MTKLVVYRQLRMDGGVRTAIAIDEETVYGLYVEGETEDDPRLRWFVDLRCDGPKLPRSPRGARKWLLDNAPVIRDGLLQCAQDIRAGFDPDSFPISWGNFAKPPAGVQMKIVVSAMRRIDAIEMADVLRCVGSDWEHMIRTLKPARAAQR